jgi:very-short-patch-repair endonuclease
MLKPLPVATPSEKLLIRKLLIHGIKSWSNRNLHGFYPDIWIANTKILIEVDGSVHSTPEQKAKDKRRSLILRKYGYKILRFSNWMVENRSKTVVERIKAAIKKELEKERAKQLKLIKAVGD